jgi:hypothetical protein
MKNYILAIGICYLIIGGYGMDIINLPNNNVIYPNGNWALTAKNPKIDANLLCAELKNSKGIYESSCVIFNLNEIYNNIDGKFTKPANALPKGQWLYNSYKKDSIQFKNGRLCAEILTEYSWDEICIDVGEDDKVGFSSGRFYRY